MSLREEIGSILDAAGIRHALIGALALSAYGVNRAKTSSVRSNRVSRTFLTDVGTFGGGSWKADSGMVTDTGFLRR